MLFLMLKISSWLRIVSFLLNCSRIGLSFFAIKMKDILFGFCIGIIDANMHHKAIELSFRAGQKYLLAQKRILCGHHQKKFWQLVSLIANANLPLTHSLKQGRLDLRGRSIYLIGQNQIVKYGASLEGKACIFGIKDVAAGNIRRQKIGCKFKIRWKSPSMRLEVALIDLVLAKPGAPSTKR